MMTIREATAADLPALHGMVSEFLASSRYGALMAADPAKLEALLELLGTFGGVVLVAETDALVGMLALVVGPHPLTTETVAEELAWWVAPAARRDGRVGLRLLRAAEAWARDHGVIWLTLADPVPLEAVGRYDRFGYTALETRSIKRLTPVVEAEAM